MQRRTLSLFLLGSLLVLGCSRGVTDAPSPNSVTKAQGEQVTTVKEEKQAKGEEKSADEEIITNSIGMKLVRIPAGEFLMGRPNLAAVPKPRGVLPDDDNETPQHSVRISQPFYMSQTEVTQAQWKAVGASASPFASLLREPWNEPDVEGKPSTAIQGDDVAASYIDLQAATMFCEILSELENQKYQLPTEAQWEYACRAGTTTRWHFGDDISLLPDYAWIGPGAHRDIKSSERHARPVAKKLPNPLGLYDMYGNVWEWCRDAYSPTAYQKRTGVVQDPVVGPPGNEVVIRGGSFANFGIHSATRLRKIGSDPKAVNGFRVVRIIEPVQETVEDRWGN